MKLNKYPTDGEAKKMIVDIGRRMYEKNFVAANDGNISVKVDDDPRACYFKQVLYGKYMRMALMLMLLGIRRGDAE